MWGPGSSTERHSDGPSEGRDSEQPPRMGLAEGVRHKSKSSVDVPSARGRAADSVEAQPSGESSCRQAEPPAVESRQDHSPAASLPGGAVAGEAGGSRGGSPGPGQLRAATRTPPLKERLRGKSRTVLSEQAWSRGSPIPTGETVMFDRREAGAAGSEGNPLPSRHEAALTEQVERCPVAGAGIAPARTSLASGTEVRHPGERGAALTHTSPERAADPSHPREGRAEQGIEHAAGGREFRRPAAPIREQAVYLREAITRREADLLAAQKPPRREIDSSRHASSRARASHVGSSQLERQPPLPGGAGGGSAPVVTSRPDGRRGQSARRPPFGRPRDSSKERTHVTYAHPVDDHMESASHYSRMPIPDVVYAEGRGPESTANGRVEQWLRYSDSGSQQSFTQWRTEEDVTGQVIVPTQAERQRGLVQCKVQRRDGTVEPLELYYDPSLGLPPTRMRPPPGQPGGGQMVERSAFELYQRSAPARRPAAEAEDQTYGPQAKAARAPRREDLDNNPEGRFRDDRSELSRVSTSTERLRELIKQAMNPQGVKSVDQTGDHPQVIGGQLVGQQPQVAVGGQQPQRAAGNQQPLGAAGNQQPQRAAGNQQPLGAAGNQQPRHDYLRSSGDANATQLVAVAPGLQPSATSLSSHGLAKPKKLRGFSGGKDDSWETYRAHLDIVRRVNAWDDAVTLANFTAELSGAALDYFSSLPRRDTEEFGRVMEVMGQRFSTLANPRAVRGRLEKLRQKADQSIEDLAQEVRNLVTAVYHDYPWEQQEQEAVHAFMRAVASKEVVQALIQAGPVTTMEQALTVALSVRDLGQVYLNSPAKPGLVRRVGDQSTYEDSSEEGSCWSEGDMDEIRVANSGGRYRSRKTDGARITRGVCWLCGESKHFAQDCDFCPRKWPEWLKREVRGNPDPQAVPPSVQVRQGNQAAGQAAAQGAAGQPAAQGAVGQPAAPLPPAAPTLGPLQAPPALAGPAGRVTSPLAQQNAAAAALRMASELVAGLPAGEASQSSSQGKASGKGKRKRNKKKQSPVTTASSPGPQVVSGGDAAVQSGQTSQKHSQGLGN